MRYPRTGGTTTSMVFQKDRFLTKSYLAYNAKVLSLTKSWKTNHPTQEGGKPTPYRDISQPCVAPLSPSTPPFFEMCMHARRIRLSYFHFVFALIIWLVASISFLLTISINRLTVFVKKCSTVKLKVELAEKNPKVDHYYGQ